MSKYPTTNQIMRMVAESAVEGLTERGYALRDGARAAIEQMEDEVATLKAEIAGGAHDSANYPGEPRVVEMQRALKPFAELAEIELLRWGAGLPKEDVYAGTQQVTVRMLVAARDALKDAPKIEPSEEGRQREDPLSPEAINRDSAPAPVVPAAVFYALLDWSGAEPSQSVLARAMDAWAAKCGDGCSGCPTCWGKSSTPPEIEQGHAPGVEMPAAAQALQIDLDAANDRLATSEARTFKYANWAGKVEGALRYVLLQDRCQRATEEHVRTAKAEPVILLQVEYQGQEPARPGEEYRRCIKLEHGFTFNAELGEGMKTGVVIGYERAFRVNGHIHWADREGHQFHDDANEDGYRVGSRMHWPKGVVLDYTPELEAQIERVIEAVNGAANVLHKIVEDGNPAAFLMKLGAAGAPLLAPPADDASGGARP